jgi:hypothetical protein
MTEPLDSVMAFHNAFRRDIDIIDAAALGLARGEPGLEPQLDRFRFLHQVLVWHHHGEELGPFPALEAVVPSVAEAYAIDHQGLDAAVDALNAAVSAHDALETARATAALKFHLHMHLDKEDVHLYRLVRERVAAPDLVKALALMSSTTPQDRLPDVIAWIFPLLGDDDRENLVRVGLMVLPPEVSAGIKAVIQQAAGDGWAELTRRIPTLA